MAFNVLAQAGRVQTIKDDETVVVQVVNVTNRQGASKLRIEARLMVDTDNYSGPTKTALVFDDADEVETLCDALRQAAASFRAHGAQAPAAPVVKKARAKRPAAKKAVAAVA